MTDLTMPRLDGYGLMERIRTSGIERIRTMPVLVVSGAQEQTEHDRVRAAGATDLIGKGVTSAELLARLALLAVTPPPLAAPDVQSGFPRTGADLEIETDADT